MARRQRSLTREVTLGGDGKCQPRWVALNGYRVVAYEGQGQEVRVEAFGMLITAVWCPALASGHWKRRVSRSNPMYSVLRR